MTVTGLTADLIERLKAPFPLDAHELRDGGGRDGKLVYLTEEPVVDRLSEVDPNWEFTIQAIYQTNYGGAQPDSVTVHGELTICGVRRANVGTAVANMKTREWDKAQNRSVALETPVIFPLGEMELKGAATDALKRCARMFGVGAYLLRTKGQKFTSDADFERWYVATFGGGENRPARTTKTPQPAAANSGKPAPKQPTRATKTEQHAQKPAEGAPPDDALLRGSMLPRFVAWVLSESPDLEPGDTMAAGKRALERLGLKRWEEAAEMTVGEAKVAYTAAELAEA